MGATERLPSPAQGTERAPGGPERLGLARLGTYGYKRGVSIETKRERGPARPNGACRTSYAATSSAPSSAASRRPARLAAWPGPPNWSGSHGAGSSATPCATRSSTSMSSESGGGGNVRAIGPLERPEFRRGNTDQDDMKDINDPGNFDD